MKLYIARHAETNYNVLGLCNDDPTVDVHLTQKGIDQANVLAQNLKDASLQHIVVSRLPRTRATALIINQFHDVPVSEDGRVDDIHNGYEGLPAKEYRAALEQADNRWTVKLNGGESYEEMKARVSGFVTSLRKSEDSSTLIVTHQIIAQLIYGLIKKLPNEEIVQVEVGHASYIELELLQ